MPNRGETLISPSVSGPAARAEDLAKRYGSGPAAVTALAGVSVEIPAGSFTAVMGPSGSGKSTLLHCMAGLDSPDSGRVWIGGEEITAMVDRQLTRLRRDWVGFVFQAFYLLPVLPAAGNITLPLDIAGRDPDPGCLPWCRRWARPGSCRTGRTNCGPGNWACSARSACAAARSAG